MRQGRLCPPSQHARPGRPRPSAPRAIPPGDFLRNSNQSVGVEQQFRQAKTSRIFLMARPWLEQADIYQVEYCAPR
jgi:hypothetical protein